MKRNSFTRMLLGALVALALAVFATGCGTAPTAVDAPDQPGAQTNGTPDHWW